MEVDDVVVGAGPAGSATAITLARAGRSVLMIDKARFPRDKCCGDGLTTLALRLGERLGLNLNSLSNSQSVNSAVVHSPSGRILSFPLPVGNGSYAAVVPRSDYDAALLDLARSNGANVQEECPLVSIESLGSTVKLKVKNLGTVHTSTVVAADGTWSPVRRALGLSIKPKWGEWLAFRQYASDVGPEAADLHVWFERDLLPGYAWSFPLPENRANVGFGMLRGHSDSSAQTGRLANNLFDRPAIRSVLGDEVFPEGRMNAWPIPSRINKAVLAHGPVLFVGDAAAATDILTGEGIGQALLTGILAGKAVVAGGTITKIGQTYKRSVHRHLLADHRISVVLQHVLSGPLRTRAALGLAGAFPWTQQNFARWMFEDYPRALLMTPRRWHRGAFRQPGAYAIGYEGDHS